MVGVLEEAGVLGVAQVGQVHDVGDGDSACCVTSTLNLVKLVVEPFDPDSETVDLSFPDRLGDRLDAEKRRRSRWTSRRDVEVNDTLESFFSICQAPNELEINFLSQYLGLEKASVLDWCKWLSGSHPLNASKDRGLTFLSVRSKQQRIEHLFVTRKLPQGNSVRMLDHRLRQSLHDIFPPRLDIPRPAGTP